MEVLFIDHMTVVWVAAIIIFIIVEIITQGLTSIWFAGGALGGCIAAMTGAGPLIQVIVFIAVTVILLIATRPFKKRMDRKIQKTNAETAVGQVAFVEEKIKAGLTGRVKLDGKIWTARSDCIEDIPVGQQVMITDIKGVTLIVTKH